MEEIITLQQQIGEFGVTHAGTFVADTPAHAFLAQHVAHTEVLAYVPQKLNQLELVQPIRIVNDNRSVGWI